MSIIMIIADDGGRLPPIIRRLIGPRLCALNEHITSHFLKAGKRDEQERLAVAPAITTSPFSSQRGWKRRSFQKSP